MQAQARGHRLGFGLKENKMDNGFLSPDVFPSKYVVMGAVS